MVKNGGKKVATSTVTIIILLIGLIFWATELFPIGITAVLICIALVITKTVTLSMAFGGFASDLTLMIVGMMIVGQALFKTKVAKLLGLWVINKVGNRPIAVMAAILTVCTILSGFVSNTACMAMFGPVIAAIAVSSNGTISGKFMHMPLSWAANAGGVLTLVGSTPQLVAQAVMVKSGVEGFTIFGFTPIGAVLSIVTILYSCTIGYKMSKRLFVGKVLDDYIAAEQAEVGDTCSDKGIEEKITTKGWIAIGTMLLMVVLFCTTTIHNYSVGLVAIIGAAIIVVTGCMTDKEAYQSVDWGTIMIMGGAMGLATAMDKTGAGKIIADTVLGWLGSSATPYTLFVAITVLATIQTQVMSCTGTAAILTPIALFMAKSMGIDPHAIVVGIIMGSNLAMMTPIGSVPSSMAAGTGKYSFMDFVKLGTPLTIILLILTILVTPIFFPM